jgi:hypothetical protein
MLKTIWKFSFEVTDYVTLSLPKGYRILKVDKCHNNENPKMWVEFPRLNANLLEAVRFRIFGTGHEFDDSNLEFVATFFERIPDLLSTMSGDYSGDRDAVAVWHLYKEK